MSLLDEDDVVVLDRISTISGEYMREVVEVTYDNAPAVELTAFIDVLSMNKSVSSCAQSLSRPRATKADREQHRTARECLNS